MSTNVWDVSRMRRLLCWAKDEQRITEERDATHATHDTSLDELERMFALEDTRVTKGNGPFVP